MVYISSYTYLIANMILVHLFICWFIQQIRLSDVLDNTYPFMELIFWGLGGGQQINRHTVCLTMESTMGKNEAE